MKQLKVTVNGIAYDVCVEEVGEVASAPVAAPAPAAPAAAGVEVISAPMPGTILSVNVTVGQAVKKGDAVIILEAMKMEIPVVAPEDGTVAGINVSVGDAVESGDVLATMN